MKLFWIGLLLSCLFFASTAGAGAPVPLGVSWAGGQQETDWVEQQQTSQTTPTNPFTACFWSVNDHGSWTSSGYLDPGQSATRTTCRVADYGTGAPYGFTTASTWAAAAVTTTICYQPQGRCFTATPVYVPAEHAYHSTLCIRAQYHQSDPLMQEIPDSLGGYGLITTITTTIKNNGSKRVRDILAKVGYASDIAVFLHWQDADGCLANLPYVDHFEYPFEWTTS